MDDAEFAQMMAECPTDFSHVHRQSAALAARLGHNETTWATFMSDQAAINTGLRTDVDINRDNTAQFARFIGATVGADGRVQMPEGTLSDIREQIAAQSTPTLVITPGMVKAAVAAVPKGPSHDGVENLRPTAHSRHRLCLYTIDPRTKRAKGIATLNKAYAEKMHEKDVFYWNRSNDKHGLWDGKWH